jgi:hypothetical protein
VPGQQPLRWDGDPDQAGLWAALHGGRDLSRPEEPAVRAGAEADGETVVTRNDRRDLLFLLAVLAHALLTLLGKAGQEWGMERMLGATRPGGISLFRQGLLLWDLLPRMREDRLRALIRRFGELLRQHVPFTGILGVL